MTDRKLPRCLSLALPIALLAVLAWQLNFLCDDAFISFRYTRNLVDGLGLVYNPNAGTPVEGYSNFLWVLMMAPFEWTGIDLGFASCLISTLCGLLLCGWISAHARARFELNDWGTLGTGLFFASLPCSALWCTGGLATMPSALLLFGVYVNLLGDERGPRGLGAGLWAAGAVLMRADGFLWIGMLLAGAGLFWWLEGRPAQLTKALIQVAGIVACVTLTQFAWRYSYYGDWLPNTARVKAGFSSFRLERGFNYLMQWWLTLPSLAVVLLLALNPKQLSKPGPMRAALCTSLSLALGAPLYALWVGGDFMPYGRFLFACVPFLTLLFACHLKRLSSTGSKGTLGASAMALVLITGNALACFDLNPVPESVRQGFHFRASNPEWQSEMSMRNSMVERAAEWTQLGRALGLFTTTQDSITLAGIGAVGYYSPVHIFDLFGLVSPEVIPASIPIEQATPGHDRMVPVSFFYDQHPSIGAAFVARRDASLSYNMPPGWAQHPMSQIMRMERHPLPDDDHFPPGLELRLLRFPSWP